MKQLSKKIALTLLFGASIMGATLAWAQQRMVNVPAGTRLLVRMNETVDSSRSRAGSIFTATLQTNLTVGNDVVAPAGTEYTAASRRRAARDVSPDGRTCNWS
jgi:hypothetical protein